MYETLRLIIVPILTIGFLALVGFIAIKIAKGFKRFLFELIDKIKE